MGQLQGKRIIVTGGAGGIGGAAIQAMHQEGARIACTYNTEAPTLPAGVISARCDITSKISVDAMFDQFAQHLGGVDVLVHAAGAHGSMPAADLSEAEWDRMFALNCKAMLFTNQAAFRHMNKSGGSIINMGSVEGVRGFAGNAAYASSRGAVMSFTRSIALEWGRHNIRANCVAPAVETRLAQRMFDKLDDAGRTMMAAYLQQVIPLGGKMGDPLKDLAPVIVFLASDASGFITGQVIAVDGGLMMVGS